MRFDLHHVGHVRPRSAKLLQNGCTKWNVSIGSLAKPNSELAPGRGLEPRTLRLTDRCGPFRNHGLYSPSAVEYHGLARFFAGIAVRTDLQHQPPA